MTYAYSHERTGPFLAPVEFKTPQAALEMGRARLDEKTVKVVYVAKVRELKPSDGLLPPELFFGEMEERLVTRFGSAAAEWMESWSSDGRLAEVYSAVAGFFDEALPMEMPFLVPLVVRGYHMFGGEAARESDFVPGARPEDPDEIEPSGLPSIKDLM